VFAAACRAHQAGQVRQAEQLYRQVLQDDPAHAQAGYLLAAACHAQGNIEEAMAAGRQLLHHWPQHAPAHNLLGVLLAEQGRLSEAVDCFCRALQLRPDSPDALKNLHRACKQLGTEAAAVATLERALHLRPHDAALYYRLGLVLTRQNRLAEAADRLRQAVGLEPNHAEWHGSLGVAYLLGNRLPEAAGCFEQVLRLRPGYAEAHYNLGVVRLKQDRWREAAAFFEQVLEDRPAYADAHNGLGLALLRLDRLNEALAHFQRALDQKSDVADVYCNQGYALAVAGRHAEALASLDKALQLQPEHADAHFERALVWLLLGDWQRGLPEYEWRLKTTRFPEVAARLPRWDGSPPAGRAVLLHAEQGYGDCLQLVRYAPLVRQRGAQVVLSCPDALVPLLSRCAGIDRLVAASAPLPPCDVQASLLSLPLLVGTTPETVPAPIPYLFAEAALVESWRQVLPPGGPFKIGIAWQGNPSYRKDNLRSIPLRHFAPLAGLDGVQLYSLQKGHGSEQLRDLADRFRIIDLGGRLSEQAGAFTDTAAALMNLDLLVAPDTAVVHLAGGLGVPVFAALSLAPDWRWLLGREDTPWYPSVRLFRQTERGNWDAVFQQIAAAVAQRLSNHCPHRQGLV
jgi:tetratricopeptide (TPR) repeat protein